MIINYVSGKPYSKSEKESPSIFQNGKIVGITMHLSEYNEMAQAYNKGKSVKRMHVFRDKWQRLIYDGFVHLDTALNHPKLFKNMKEYVMWKDALETYFEEYPV